MVKGLPWESSGFKTLLSNAGDMGSIPDHGAKSQYTLWPKNQNIKQKQYCNKFNKDFKMVHIKKILKKIIDYIRDRVNSVNTILQNSEPPIHLPSPTPILSESKPDGPVISEPRSCRPFPAFPGHSCRSGARQQSCRCLGGRHSSKDRS